MACESQPAGVRTPNGKKPTVGWREWVGLPCLGIQEIKAKIDTGARSSCLHAFNLKRFEKEGRPFVRFEVHPIQRSHAQKVEIESPVLEERKVRSSNGHVSVRPVILTQLELLGARWDIELTLANRDVMGFRMLLGREALRTRVLIDCGRSYFGRRAARSKLRRVDR